EEIDPFMTAPWEEEITEVQNLGLSKEEAKKAIDQQLTYHKANGNEIIFTDGSSIPKKGVGAAAFSEQESRWIRVGKEDEHSTFEAELMGLNLAVKILETTYQNENYNEIAIFSDNQAALRTIAKP
ncbi:hypothetical protein DFH28DRAFT_850214, partial [Melampsora americana]